VNPTQRRVSKAEGAPGVLGHDLRLELSRPIPRVPQRNRTDFGQHRLRRVAIAVIPTRLDRTFTSLIAQLLTHGIVIYASARSYWMVGLVVCSDAYCAANCFPRATLETFPVVVVLGIAGKIQICSGIHQEATRPAAPSPAGPPRRGCIRARGRCRRGCGRSPTWPTSAPSAGKPVLDGLITQYHRGT
jgi:hypothetical protein